jgi:hypothetical protein
MSTTTSTASELTRPFRRSTRLNQAVPIVVMGVDSYRGPYREEVATVSISCHGCKYESKHDVLTNSWVMLEIKGQTPDAPSIRTRGLVRWVKKAVDNGGLQQTAIELEDFGNVWGVATPPEDWFAYTEPDPDAEPRLERAKPALVRKQESSALTRDSYDGASAYTGTASNGNDRPVGQLMGDFQRQMEQTLFAAAVSAVRERTAASLDEVRDQMREEANRVVSEVAAQHSKSLMAQFAKEIKKAGAENAKELRAEWEKKIRTDLETASSQIGERNKQLEIEAQKLASNAIERVQRGLETSHKETVGKIVDRLKAQLAPVVEEAKQATAELNKCREGIEQAVAQSGELVSARIAEVCARFEQQFAETVAKQIEAANKEIARTTEGVSKTVVGNLDALAQKQEAGVKERFAAVLTSVSQAKLKELKDKADEASRQFADELEGHSREHLELVGSAFSSFAKGISRSKKD